ncbi:MAG: hypothetical protein IKP86_11365 [Anaerolineaceae bacterium]|nr:hypothetical protein [Anaerolineaceae bacterium]
MKDLEKAYILNICLAAFEVFSIGWMMSGINGGVLSAAKLASLKYFTVDSNILMGIAAFWAAIDQGKVLKGKKAEVPALTYILKLAGTVSVTLTMLVTIFFLGPTMGRTYGFFSLFEKSNFFLHLFNPVLSLIVFLCFEKSSKIEFKHTFTAVIPLMIYGVYYVTETVTHMTNGAIAKGYDWYGFFFLGLRSAYIVLPLIIIITWLISFTLWKLNRKTPVG